MHWYDWVFLISVSLVAVLWAASRIRTKMMRKALAKERAEAGLPEPTDRFEVVPIGDKRVGYKCGHDGPKDYKGHFYGLEMEPAPEVMKSREKCPDCQLAEMKPFIIRCALCGLPIFPGEPIALYAGPASAFTKAWSTIVDKQFVGCLRTDCCPSGGFFAGHWTGKEVRNAFGGGTAVSAAFASGNMVIVGDMSDPSSISITPLPKNEKED